MALKCNQILSLLQLDFFIRFIIVDCQKLLLFQKQNLIVYIACVHMVCVCNTGQLKKFAFEKVGILLRIEEGSARRSQQIPELLYAVVHISCRFRDTFFMLRLVLL